VGKGQVGVTGAAEGNLTLSEVPAPVPTGHPVSFIEGRREYPLRGEAVVSPETSEDLDVWEVDVFQEFGKLPLGQEGTAGCVLSVYTVLRWHEEFDTGGLGCLSEGALLANGGSSESGDHDIDALESSNKARLVGVIDLGELGTLGEPFWVGGLDGFLASEKSGPPSVR